MTTDRRLPSLNLLRGFEAAARNLSFTRAADELCLTQGAISRQIRELEGFLGKPLFRRMTRQVALTEEGEVFYESIQDALNRIDEATHQILYQPAKQRVRLNILPTLSTHWLMPRLSQFTREHPDIEVTLVSSIDPVNLIDREADIAIRVGPLPGHTYDKLRPRISLNMISNWSGVVSDELFQDVLVPVCAPDLLEGHRHITPREIADLPLIQTTTRPYGWVDWFAAHQLPSSGIRYQSEFGHFFMSLDAALKGEGVAIVPTVIFAIYAQRAQLIIPIDIEHIKNTASAGSYQMLIASRELQRPEIQLFRSWIREQAGLLKQSDPASTALH